MMKTRSKRSKTVMRIVMILAGIIVSANILGFIANFFLSRGELDSIAPYGQLVNVEGGKMHVFSMGNGEETIVLLPGTGVSLPSADFGPLMRKLSEKHTVVALEYFGVGFSDKTDTPRTNENYTNEIRTALRQAGFEAPYILMPHSSSGIYSEYYATKHPDEVSAIIMLDTTSSAVKDEKNPWYMGAVYSLARYQQAVGMTRLAFSLMPETKLIENGYTRQEQEDYKRFSYHLINKTFVDHSLQFIDNILEVNERPFPSSIPVLKIISQASIDIMSKRDKSAGMAYQQAHLARLGDNASYRILNASHFVYQTRVDEIVELTTEFLSGRDQ
jgi:pimeloyl-ACP methyl ester carboxylesterase